MSDDRHISDDDAAAIASAIAQNDPAARQEAAKNALGDALRGDLRSKKQRTDSRARGRIGMPPPDVEE
jgi:hypothetical protein